MPIAPRPDVGRGPSQSPCRTGAGAIFGTTRDPSVADAIVKLIGAVAARVMDPWLSNSGSPKAAQDEQDQAIDSRLRW
jgi:hypothetical protein